VGSTLAAAIVGDASNEEGYLVQRIMREALGSPHVDSRPSRGAGREALVRLAAPEISAAVRDVDAADAILVLGTDPLHSSPILDLRIRKAIRRNGAKLVVATEGPTALDGGAVAVTRYAPGGAARFLAELAEGLRVEGESTEIADVLRGAERIVVIWGDRIARGEDGAMAALLDLAATLDLASKEGSGLLEVPSFANARGLREVGCLPDAGPGLTPVSSTTEVTKTGMTGKGTEGIRAALESGELTTLLLFGADPLRDFPDTEAWKNALAKADVVCFSMFENATTAMADVVFPLETHAEKDGTVTHPDGRLQRVRASASRPGDIRPSWGVLAELSLALGHDTGISSQPSAFAALTEAVPFYAGITDSAIGGRGVRWQDMSTAIPGRGQVEGADSADAARRAEEPVSASGTGASGTVSGESGPTDLPDLGGASSPGSPDTQRESASADPGVLALSTYRDLWAGPITELNPPLKFLQPQQRVELSVADAERLGLKAGDPVRVSQNGSSVSARVVVKERVPEGTCFMLEGVAEGNANALLNGAPVGVRIEKDAVRR
jgi:NADH-quinone oxidoreductase subunit G